MGKGLVLLLVIGGVLAYLFFKKALAGIGGESVVS